MSHVIRWILAAAALAWLLAGGSRPPWTTALSAVLAAGVLALGLAWSDSNWKQALLAVFVFEFLVGMVNGLDEGIFFHVLSWGQVPFLLAGGAFASLVLAAVLALAPPLRGRPVSGVEMQPHWGVRVLLLAGAYVLLYFTAGAFVWPYVKAFYQSRPLPGRGTVIVAEVVRSLIYVAAAWPWLRLLKGRRVHAVLFFGAAYSIVGGISPLLLPNPLMPGPVRLAHGFEVGISNFVFGALLGWALGGRPAPKADPLPAGAGWAQS